MTESVPLSGREAPERYSCCARNRVLALVHTPPPVHGASVMSVAAVNALSETLDVTVIRISTSNTIEGIGQASARKLLALFKLLLRLASTLATMRFDSIYITLSPTTSAFFKDALLLAIGRIFVPRALIHLHGKGVRQAAADSAMMRWSYQRVFRLGTVIHLSDSLARDVLWTGTRVQIVPNGVAVPAPTISPRDIDILFLSNIVESKGPFILLRALRKLSTSTGRVTVKFCGKFEDDTFRKLFTEEVASLPENLDVEVIDGAYGDAKFALMQRARIFCLPTFYECFPVTVLEAMGSGAAVVSTPEGAISEIVPSGDVGSIVTQRDVDGLADALLSLLGDPVRLEGMGVRARRRYEEHYSQDVFAKRLRSVVEDEIRGEPG